jgi:uncharacterized protein
MGVLKTISDGLTNALTGSGTRRDPRAHNAYAARILSQVEIANAYSGSGLMRKIIRIPAMDMVREWRTWSGGDDKQIAAMHDAERKFAVPQKIMQAEVLRGMGGGAIILGLPGDPTQPADENAPLAFMHVVSRWHLSFAQLDLDANSPGYGEPQMWTLSTSGAGSQQIHPSRVIPFRADTSASMLLPSITGLDQFWGESTVQQVLDAVQDSDLARQSFAALIHKARLMRIGIPDLLSLSATADGEAMVMKRLALLAAAESIHNATIFDAGDAENGKGGESITDAQYNFAGVKDVLSAYGEWAAAISDIPATRLLGRAPEGMNSSGDSQQKDWNKRVRAMQTLDLAPCLDRLDRHLVAAAGQNLGMMSYEFDPLDSPSEKERADIFKVEMEAAEKLQLTGAVPDRAFSRGLQSLMIERGYLPELELALAEMPDDERFGISQEREGGDPESLGGGADDPNADPASLADAAPRTLYVSRPVLNRGDLQRWATAQGLGELQDDLHVTIAYSRTPLDWMKVEHEDWNQERDGTIEIPPGGVRIVEPLGDRTAVLLFGSSRLAWRHEQIKRAGAAWDYADYQPHVSLTGEPVSLEGVEPYRGVIRLGPEKFEEVKE